MGLITEKGIKKYLFRKKHGGWIGSVCFFGHLFFALLSMSLYSFDKPFWTWGASLVFMFVCGGLYVFVNGDPDAGRDLLKRWEEIGCYHPTEYPTSPELKAALSKFMKEALENRAREMIRCFDRQKAMLKIHNELKSQKVVPTEIPWYRQRLAYVAEKLAEKNAEVEVSQNLFYGLWQLATQKEPDGADILTGSGWSGSRDADKFWKKIEKEIRAAMAILPVFCE